MSILWMSTFSSLLRLRASTTAEEEVEEAEGATTVARSIGTAVKETDITTGVARVAISAITSTVLKEKGEGE